MRRVWRNLVCAILVVAALGARLAMADPADDFAKDYGSPKAALSSREAGQLLLKLVNAERGKHGLSQLQLSTPAGKLAKQHADDMAAHNYVGHYDLAGRKCELRYNLLGETDHVAENIDYREVGARARLTPELVRSIFADWMGHDSHRNNILDAAHTHMGYAFATHSGGQKTTVYAVQEFVNDWGGFSRLPSTTGVGSALKLSGHLASGVTLAYVGLAIEAAHRPRQASEIGEADLHYSQPAPYLLITPDNAAPLLANPDWKPGHTAGIQREADNGFEADFIAPRQIIETPEDPKPSDLYVTVWVSGPLWPTPVRAMTQVVGIGY